MNMYHLIPRLNPDVEFVENEGLHMLRLDENVYCLTQSTYEIFHQSLLEETNYCPIALGMSEDEADLWMARCVLLPGTLMECDIIFPRVNLVNLGGLRANAVTKTLTFLIVSLGALFVPLTPLIVWKLLPTICCYDYFGVATCVGAIQLTMFALLLSELARGLVAISTNPEARCHGLSFSIPFGFDLDITNDRATGFSKYATALAPLHTLLFCCIGFLIVAALDLPYCSMMCLHSAAILMVLLLLDFVPGGVLGNSAGTRVLEAILSQELGEMGEESLFDQAKLYLFDVDFRTKVRESKHSFQLVSAYVLVLLGFLFLLFLGLLCQTLIVRYNLLV